eukprot:CAMPEP_0198334002 /NCGR_PEP_ID=MMETSP1450-20131203/19330_1 /TAXON_ID=753684 ORGANISM="Madagascaria erythrocladiodes, Strain CCMP3234" /NCGR_SAMPLE_ID=MMETSP1450 /ASSEMBLY_ACC=CAM_ASM_001115 /LENGTH=720 /DNA_ID=CAMNT_0044038559 /DNA_START=60 /DNA_END=2222 /DNA_ORIENTATION=-
MRDSVEGVTVVDDEESAEKVLAVLYDHPGEPVAWDTETQGVDPSVESPVGKGRVICASAYGGMDFGTGHRLWVDNLDECAGVLGYFAEYFRDDGMKKVWHNYSFDKHVMKNTGIECRGLDGDTMHMARLEDTSRQSYSLEALARDMLHNTKVTMKERFGAPRVLKNNTLSKDLVVPPPEEIQRSVEHIKQWIEYACDDAEFTWQLRNALQALLEREKVDESGYTLYDVYQEYMVPFANTLVDMEYRGFKVDLRRLKEIEQQAIRDRDGLDLAFRNWAGTVCPDAREMNINSDKQKKQFFFAPVRNQKTGDLLGETKEFEAPMTEEEAAAAEKEAKRARVKKRKKIFIKGLQLPVPEWTASGWPSVSQTSIRKLCGRPPKYGDAFDKIGAEGCESIAKMLESSAVSTLVTSFMVPLQAMADEGGRIHASLNLNTETGRLSCRRPNLQNQPALEKDLYKIRDCFTCERGNQLIVADYGQLELRLLAHLTKCEPMIAAFASGGDFHSRTALSMYKEIQEAVGRGEVVLEGGDGRVPTLKEKFATERRRAKTLNFSIAYGKTAVGLARDWGISVEEARDTVERWYGSRPGVREWQAATTERARETGYVTTLLGRRRHLPDLRARFNYRARAHAERAAINAPLQGSAADVVMAAMVVLDRDAMLRELGWRLLLQIHDEVVLEGPAGSAEAAAARTRAIMEQPLATALRVGLAVDLQTGGTWYAAK